MERKPFNFTATRNFVVDVANVSGRNNPLEVLEGRIFDKLHWGGGSNDLGEVSDEEDDSDLIQFRRRMFEPLIILLIFASLSFSFNIELKTNGAYR